MVGWLVGGNGGGVHLDKDDVPPWVLTPARRMPTETPRPSWSLWARARDTPPVSFRGRSARGLAWSSLRPPRKPTATGTSGLANHDTRPQVDGQPIRTRGDHPVGLTCACTAPCLARIHLLHFCGRSYAPEAPREHHVRGGRITGDSHRGCCHAIKHPINTSRTGTRQVASGPSDAFTVQFGPWVDQPAGKAPVGRMTRHNIYIYIYIHRRVRPAAMGS